MQDLKRISNGVFTAYGRDRHYSIGRVWREVTIEVRRADGSVMTWSKGTGYMLHEPWAMTAHRFAAPFCRVHGLCEP